MFVLIITCISSAGVPQTPIHLKPQLARSASKTRGIRAPEVGDPRKGDMQSSGIDILETTPTRPPQLAPVKVSFSTIHVITYIASQYSNGIIFVIFRLNVTKTKKEKN